MKIEYWILAVRSPVLPARLNIPLSLFNFQLFRQYEEERKTIFNLKASI